MFTKQEKDFISQVWKTVLPAGKSREEMVQNLKIIDAIQVKIDALPVEEPVESLKDALSPELVKTVQEATNGKRTRRR